MLDLQFARMSSNMEQRTRRHTVSRPSKIVDPRYVRLRILGEELVKKLIMLLRK